MQTAQTLKDHITANAEMVFLEMGKTVQVSEKYNFSRYKVRISIALDNHRTFYKIKLNTTRGQVMNSTEIKR